MKRSILSLGISLLLLVVAGCQKYEEATPATLEVSSKTLSVPAQGKEYTVSVKASAPEWEAMAEASWVQTYVNQSELKIVAEPNYNPVARQTLVKVIASGQVQTIAISQEGVPAEAKLFPETAALDQFGGLEYVYVTTNTQAWTLESNVEWITATPNYTKRRAEVTIQANTETTSRTGVVTLLDNGVALGTYTVVQEGVKIFILPFKSFLSNPYEVQDYEKSRHSTLVKLPDGVINSSVYGFKTHSPLFPNVEYTFSNNQYVEARLYAVDAELLANDTYKNKIIEFLKSEGFLFDFGSIYVQPDINMEATLVPAKGTTRAHIYFRFLPEQPEGMPAFTEFPYGCLEFKVGDEAKIHEYEAAHGGTYVPDKSTDKALCFQTKSPSLYRLYYLGDQSVQAFDDYRYAYFFHQGTPYLTREFRKLLAAEGFEMMVKLDFMNMYKYKNERKKIFMDVWIRNESVDGVMKQVIRFNIRSSVG